MRETGGEKAWLDDAEGVYWQRQRPINDVNGVFSLDLLEEVWTSPHSG